VGAARQASKSSRKEATGKFKEPSEPRERSRPAFQRSSSRIRNQRERQRESERERREHEAYDMSHQGQRPGMATYGQYMGPAGQFIIPQYSADGTLLGIQTRHHEPSGQAEQFSGSRSGRDTGRKAKVQRTGSHQEPSEPAQGDRRGAAMEPPRQSSFTEVRGKRQQYDVVDISDDDDDVFAGLGRSNVFQWHRPSQSSREPPSHTMTLAEATAYGLQEGGRTVTHHTIPAGDESDSDGLSSPLYDPFRVEEREDVSSGHELDSVVTGLGPGYELSDVEPMTPSMPLLEPEVLSTPVTFIAAPQSQVDPTDMHDVAVGADEPQPWYTLPVGTSLQQVIALIQRNVGVPVREILATEFGNPEQQDSLVREVVETFTAFGAATYQVAISDVARRLQNLEAQIRTAGTPETASSLRAAAWQAMTELVASVQDWNIPYALLGQSRQR